MKYESLYSLYYKDSQIWEKVYQERFHSPFSRHLPLAIKQYHRRQSHPAFFCYSEEIALSLEKIASEVMDCLDIIHQVPPAAISQFLHMSLVDEIKSTNDIEGVRSTRKEILMAFSFVNMRINFFFAEISTHIIQFFCDKVKKIYHRSQLVYGDRSFI